MAVDPSSIYNNTDFSPKPAPANTVLSREEGAARLIYNNTVPEGQQREARAAFKEDEQRNGMLGDGTAAGDDRKDTQGAPQSNGAKPGEEPFRTKLEIANAAQQLTAELKLDTSDPAAQPFATVAAEIGLDKAKAEKLVEFDRQRTERYWSSQSEQWAAKSQREFSNFDLAGARTMAQRFGDAELHELLGGPFGNHPAIVRLLVKASRAIR